MSSKPGVVLVHGFWGDAAHWSRVITDLHHSGYDNVYAVELSLDCLRDDADRVRRRVANLRGPVLLVGHSYGGAVITEAGTADGVAGLVYVAAFAPDTGESVGQINDTWPATTGAANVTPDADGYLWIDRDEFHESFAQDLSADEAYVMAVTQKPPPVSTFGDPVTTAAWRSKPSWYQVSTQDRMINPDAERSMATRMRARQIIEIDAGHASLASRPTEIANLIEDAAATIA